MRTFKLAATLVFFAGIVSAQSILGVTGWSGTVQVVANQNGSGSSGFAGFVIAENYTLGQARLWSVDLLTRVRRPKVTSHCARELSPRHAQTRLFHAAAVGAEPVYTAASAERSIRRS